MPPTWAPVVDAVAICIPRFPPCLKARGTSQKKCLGPAAFRTFGGQWCLGTAVCAGHSAVPVISSAGDLRAAQVAPAPTRVHPRVGVEISAGSCRRGSGKPACTRRHSLRLAAAPAAAPSLSAVEPAGYANGNWRKINLKGVAKPNLQQILPLEQHNSRGKTVVN